MLIISQWNSSHNMNKNSCFIGQYFNHFKEYTKLTNLMTLSKNHNHIECVQEFVSIYKVNDRPLHVQREKDQKLHQYRLYAHLDQGPVITAKKLLLPVKRKLTITCYARLLLNTTKVKELLMKHLFLLFLLLQEKKIKFQNSFTIKLRKMKKRKYKANFTDDQKITDEYTWKGNKSKKKKLRIVSGRPRKEFIATQMIMIITCL